MRKTIELNHGKPGVIERDALYTIDEAADRLRLGKAAFRTARRQSLIVRKIGRRAYVYGGDLIEWFQTEAKTV